MSGRPGTRAADWPAACIRVGASPSEGADIGGVRSLAGGRQPVRVCSVAAPGPDAPLSTPGGGCGRVTLIVGVGGGSAGVWSAVGGNALESAMLASRGTRPAAIGTGWLPPSYAAVHGPASEEPGRRFPGIFL